MNKSKAPTPPPVRSAQTGTRKQQGQAHANKGPVNKGPQNRGPHNKGPQNKGPQNRGSYNKGPQNKGPQNRGSYNKGPRGQGRGNKKPGVHFGPSRAQETPEIKQPPRNPDGMYLIPLGGLEEIGRNSAAVEYKGDIVIIDCGLMFPSENMHGIDYIIPDISPLAGKEKRVKGVIITHAHLDHFGGVPYIIPKLGNPPIFGW